MIRKGIVLFQMLLVSVFVVSTVAALAADAPPAPAKPAVITGIKVLDDDINAYKPWGMIPFWYGYYWVKLTAFPRVEQDRWTKVLYKALQDDGKLVASIPEDIGMYCPNYPYFTKDERSMFWMRFISLLIEAESSFKPDGVFTEANGTKSVGLLSLSIGDCDNVKTSDDLKDVTKNMTCGVQMMSRLMEQSHVIAWNAAEDKDDDSQWEGLARYWGPLRDARLKTDAGRDELGKLVIAKLPAWQLEQAGAKHASYYDSTYKGKETKLERILRLSNEMPICH